MSIQGTQEVLEDTFDGEAYTDRSGTATAAPAEVAPVDPGRRYMIVHNASDNAMTVRVGSPTAGPLTLPPGGNWEPLVPPTDAVYLSGTDGDAFTLYTG